MGESSDNSSDSWCLIESDPGVFYELTHQLGCTAFDFEDIYDMDKILENKNSLTKYFGYLFLFKYDKNQAKIAQSDSSNNMVQNITPGLFAPKQLVNNACATIALLSVLLNQKDVELGSVLEGIKSFCEGSGWDSELQGFAITHNHTVREVHNSFNGNTAFEFTRGNDKAKSDAFHFISYVPYEGKLYELDGLSKGPVCLGEFQNNDWHTLVHNRLIYRINNLQTGSTSSSEIRFNLISIFENEMPKLQKELRKSMYLAQEASIKLASYTEEEEILYYEELEDDDSEFDIDFQDLPDDPDKLAQMVKSGKEKIASLSTQINEAKQTKNTWKKENLFRKHNFVPFVIATMKLLSKKNKLIDMYTANLQHKLEYTNSTKS